MNMNVETGRNMTYDQLGQLLNDGRGNVVWTDKSHAVRIHDKWTVKDDAMIRRHLSYTMECRHKEVSNILISFDGGDAWTEPREYLYCNNARPTE